MLEADQSTDFPAPSTAGLFLVLCYNATWWQVSPSENTCPSGQSFGCSTHSWHHPFKSETAVMLSMWEQYTRCIDQIFEHVQPATHQHPPHTPHTPHTHFTSRRHVGSQYGGHLSRGWYLSVCLCFLFTNRRVQLPKDFFYILQCCRRSSDVLIQWTENWILADKRRGLREKRTWNAHLIKHENK